MTRCNLGLTMIATGVVFSVLGIYGVVGQFSILFAGVGILVLVIGTSLFIFALRPIILSRPHPYVMIITAVAVALHAYENIFESSGRFSVGSLFWSLTPYALCLVISAFPTTKTATVTGAVVALAFDSLVHYEVFVNPKNSTAALDLLFMPLWNCIIFAPLATYVAWLVVRRRE